MDTENSTEESIKSANNSLLSKIGGVKGIIVLVSWTVFILGWFALFSLFGAIKDNKNNWFGKIPSLKELENPETQIASEIYSADSVLLGKYFLKNRTTIQYEELSPKVVNTLMATEDIRFREHSGIDPIGIASIPYYLIRGKEKGASTVTQQLAKNLYKTRTKEWEGAYTKPGSKLRKIFVKLKEWVTAVMIESAYTKNEILTMYLNTVDFGANSFGIKVAAERYFSKNQADLKYEEAGVLVGLLKATSNYNPFINYDKSKIRRNIVLNQLVKYKFLDPTKRDSLVKTEIPLKFSSQNHYTGQATYFRTEAKKFLTHWCKANGFDINRDGLKIYSTIDSKIQGHAEDAMKEHLSEHQAKFFKHWEGKNPWTLRNSYNGYTEIEGFLESRIKRTYAYKLLKKKYGDDDEKIQALLNKKKPMKVFTWEGEKDTVLSSYDSLKYYKHFLHSGFMALEPKTGYIKAWVGGINFKYFQYDHVKQGKRQPGSTFKPIVYTTILGEIGKLYGPCYQAIDAPVTFETGDPDKPIWTPNNSDGKFTGDTLSLRQALARSKNSITAYMMKILGPQTPYKVLEYATKLGINTSKMEAVPAMCLGTFDVSLYDMVGAYGTFMNKGVYNRPQFIKAIYDRNGNLLKEFKPESHIALSEELAYVMSYMLRGATTEKNGTALGLNRYKILGGGNEIGAKTGTTQDYSDGWFMGITPQLVTGTWVGCEDRTVHFRNFKYGQGARMAMPIYGKFMAKLYEDKSTGIVKQRFREPYASEKRNYSIVTDCDEFTEIKTDSALFKQKSIEIFNDGDDDFEF